MAEGGTRQEGALAVRPEPQRLAALDAFRGATVAAMILVNNPGAGSSVYAPLEHAAWHGWTPTDLIFPFFLFLAGVSLAFSTRDSAGQAAWRALKIFALGLFGAWFLRFDLHTLRIPGVLQRIAVCYFAAFLARKWLRPPAVALLAALLLTGYWALMTFVPLPDGTLPNLEPETNLAAWIDRALLGTHLWARSKTWDPEGVLSTLPAIATTLLGVLAGGLVRAPVTLTRKVAWLAGAGTALLLAGLAWGRSFPLNKNLWTSSYVLFTAGLAALLLGGLLLVTEGLGWRRWARPFTVFGVNAIVVFVGSGLLAKTLAYVKVPSDPGPVSLQAILHRSLFASWLPPYPASLAYALANVAGWYLVLWWMDRRGWHVKV